MLTVVQQRRKRPSLTPLIDVVFLLLIFFMIVSRLSVEQQTPLALSTSSSSARQTSDNQSTKVEIQADGSLLVDGTPQSLADFINSSQNQKKQPITVALADAVTFQQTLQTMEALFAAGFSDAKLSTDRQEP